MSFKPPLGLRNPHLQTILSSMGPRKLIENKRFSKFAADSKEVMLECGDGVRLQGFFNQALTQNTKPVLPILIHGWEGSAESVYIKSLSSRLLESGYPVFRLNMRDHGDTHHINKGIFNSTLLEEVIAGIKQIQQQFAYQHYALIGFSLGGNFALRVAASVDSGINLSKVIAFCPAIHAQRSNDVLHESRNWLYAKYFMRKWKRSLHKKIQHFPEYDFASDLIKMKSLNEMNQAFIPKYTGFKDVNRYFDAYAITGDRLAKTLCPCYLYFAKDDMIVPYQDAEQIAKQKDIEIGLTEYGGHCGFLMNWGLDSWSDKRTLVLLDELDF